MEDISNEKPYLTLSAWLKRKFGRKVYKVMLDARLTCPNRDGVKGEGGCTYCEPETLVPRAYAGDNATVAEQLEVGIDKVRRRYGADAFIAYFQQGSNTYAPVAELERLYAPAVAHPEVAGLAVSTRPDCVPDPVLDLLAGIKERKHVWVELGLQSSNASTLGAINRGHTPEDFADAVERARARGLDVCAHVIAGLPGEGISELLDTVRFVSRLGVWGVKFHQLQVIRGTALAGAWDRGEFRVLTLEEYARAVVESLRILPPGVVVHRLSGEAPERFLVAPGWGANKFTIMERIEAIMAETGVRQGSGLAGAGSARGKEACHGQERTGQG